MSNLKAAGVGLTGAFVLSVAATSAGARAGDGACQARYTPDELTLSPRPVRILAETEGGTPGDLEGVRPDRESGIEVLEAERDRNAPDPTWILQLDISDAAAGEWSIELVGEHADCTGRLVIREI